MNYTWLEFAPAEDFKPHAWRYRCISPLLQDVIPLLRLLCAARSGSGKLLEAITIAETRKLGGGMSCGPSALILHNLAPSSSQPPRSHRPGGDAMDLSGGSHSIFALIVCLVLICSSNISTRALWVRLLMIACCFVSRHIAKPEMNGVTSRELPSTP